MTNDDCRMKEWHRYSSFQRGIGAGVSGKGYKFLADKIAALNAINPQVASRLLTPLIQFDSFSQPHKELMKAQLINLQALPHLSNDLKEKLDASLTM